MMEQDGILLINKPKGWSSYDVIRYIKRKFFGKLRTKISSLSKFKIGHAGTLDPMATGLLIILVGSATKKFDDFQKIPKEYIATIKFGTKTDTFDKEGKITYIYPKNFKLAERSVEKILRKFKGLIWQKPPIYSALKIRGQPAYQIARQGKKVNLKARKIKIYITDLLEVKNKKAKVRFVVSSGTYIRSLANDIGEKLKVGAYLEKLQRTKIGSFNLKSARRPQSLSLGDFKL